MIPLLIDRDIAMTPWGALSAGMLAGTIGRDGTRTTHRARTDLLRGIGGHAPTTEQDFNIQDRVREVADRNGMAMGEVALAWSLSKPYVTAPIIGASSVAQLESSVATLGKALSPEDIARLEEPYRPIMPQTLTPPHRRR